MISLKIRKFFSVNKIELYENSKEMPIDRWQEFQKLTMKHIGIGSTIEDFNSHFSILHECLANGKSEEAIQEMKNVFQGYFNAVNKVSLWSYLIAPFVKSINGNEYKVDDLNNCNDVILELINVGITEDHIKPVVDYVKKKLIENYPVTFLPSLMNQDGLMYMNP